MSILSNNYVVGFFGRRDYYQLAVALAAEGRLETLVTDAYCPDVLTSHAGCLPKSMRRKALLRRAPGLSSRFVSAPDAVVLVAAEAARLIQPGSGQVAIDTLLGRKAARRAVRARCGAVVYGYHWQGFIEAAARHQAFAPRLVFLSDALPSQLRGAIQLDRALTGIQEGKLAAEMLTPSEVQHQEQALLYADGAIVPSSYIRDGLVSRGMPPERVKVVPYGGDLAVRPDSRWGAQIPASDGKSTSLRLLWIGQLSYRKAPHHLAVALEKLGKTNVTLTVATYGQGGVDPFANVPCRVHWVRAASAGDLLRLFHMNDVLVLPTLSEGFGLVYVEALHAGLPVIATRASGGPDVVSHLVNGLLINAGDPSALSDAIRELVDNPELVVRLRNGARATGSHWTWSRFRSNVIEAIADLESAYYGHSNR
jgi:glycosyltransferase involved in cell wall biosynthesis